MTFVELPVVSIYWHFPRTVKGYCFVFESPILLHVGGTMVREIR